MKSSSYAALFLAAALAALSSGCGSAPRTISRTDSASGAQTGTPAPASDSAESGTDGSAGETQSAEDYATPLSSFAYTVGEESAAITDFTGSETAVVIPSSIEGKPVTEIGQYAFEAAWDVVSVEIPDTVVFIGEQAFLDCESLTCVNIPDGVTALYRATFAGCASLTSITIPESVTAAQEELFTGCPLTDLYVENPGLAYESWGLAEGCTIHAPEGAAILSWASENGYPAQAS